MSKNRLRIINEILKVLMSNTHTYLSVNKITERVNWNTDLEIPSRTIKQYLVDLQEQLGYTLEPKNGPDGGYKLTDETIEAISRLSQLQLNDDEKNAINDALEIAKKSATFYYNEDLEEAKRKLYLSFNFKIDDGEYYVGQEQHKPKITKLIKQFKNAIMNKLIIEVSFSYEHYGATKQLKRYKPLFVAHDVDETFVILKEEKTDKIIYQNIYNVKECITTSSKFGLAREYKITEFVNDHTIKAKGEHHLKFDLFDEEGHEIFDTWNYEFDDKSKDHNKKHIIFYEEYRVFEFLLRMQVHIKNLDMEQSLKDKWNGIIGKLQEII